MSVSWRPVWFTYQVPGQHGETYQRRRKEEKEEEEEGEEEEGNNDDDNGIPGLSDTIVLQQLGPKTTSRTLKLFSLS